MRTQAGSATDTIRSLATFLPWRPKKGRTSTSAKPASLPIPAESRVAAERKADGVRRASRARV